MALYFLWPNEDLGGFVRFGIPLLAVMVANKRCRFEAFIALLTPVILIGGMANGLFTSTEAAVAAVAWALFLGLAWFLVPVFMPIIARLGIDPVHFGLVMVLNLMIGLMTPPVGMVLFILQKVSKLSFEATVRAVLPWLRPLLATLALITYMPKLVLWLPGVLCK